MHGGAFAEIEHSALQRYAVCRITHFSAERVDFKDQMSLARPADGGVTGHVANGIEIDCEKERFQPQPCAGERRLNAGMPGTDNGDIR